MNLFTPLIGLGLLLSLDLTDVTNTFSEATVELLKNTAMVLVIILTVLFGLFLALMNKEYRKCFYSVESACQNTRRVFLEGDDVMRHTIFGTTRAYWSSFDDKVENWVRNSWERWE